MTFVRFQPRTVAIVLYSGASFRDIEVASRLLAAVKVGGREAFSVFTVAASREPVTVQDGPPVVPDHAAAEAPRADLLLVPGGTVGNGSDTIDGWMRGAWSRSETAMGSGEGALLLARAGALDVMRATTTEEALGRLEREHPDVMVVPKTAVVRDEGLVTTDGTPGLLREVLVAQVASLFGPRIAERAAEKCGASLSWRRSGKEGDGPDLDPGTLLPEIGRALVARRASIDDILGDPVLMFLHGDPRFRALVRENAVPWISLVGPDEPGESLNLSGWVRDASGEPVEGALLHVFQTDATGRYTEEKAMDEGRSRLFGYVRTAENGRYFIGTIRPGGYEELSIPRHLHVEVEAEGFRPITTQLFFEDDPRLDEAQRENALRHGFPILVVERDGRGLKVTHDFVLKRE
jgi:protocatechuate 3,4-dioxygenase beta subunit/transcriptional regulator GlxA family with amidase domain